MGSAPSFRGDFGENLENTASFGRGSESGVRSIAMLDLPACLVSSADA
jgi:hypothetical protein